MIKFSPLPSAPPEYSRDAESLFRRSVENSLLEIYSGLESAVTAQSGEASPASKRETLLLQKPVGLEVVSQVGVPIDVSESATPNVEGLSGLALFPSSPLVVTHLHGGLQGQTLTIYSTQIAGLTLEDSAGGPGSMNLAGGVDLVFPTAAGALYSNVTLFSNGTSWFETSRTILN